MAAMVPLFVLASIVVVSSSAHAAGLPSWISPGLTLDYDASSTFVKDGQNVAPVRTRDTLRVDAVAGNAVDATMTVKLVPHAPGTDQVIKLHFVQGRGDEKFWVDLFDPPGSRKGPNGETMIPAGDVEFRCAGRTWDAAAMIYENRDSGVNYMLVYDKATGLVLAYSERHPGFFMYMILRSINNPGGT